MPENDGERLAALEEWRNAKDKEAQAIHLAIIRLTTEIEKVNNTLSNWKGFFGGVAFAFTLIGGLVVYLTDLITHKVWQ